MKKLCALTAAFAAAYFLVSVAKAVAGIYNPPPLGINPTHITLPSPKPTSSSDAIKVAGVYWLPDYLEKNAGFTDRKQDDTKPKENVTCEKLGYLSSAEYPLSECTSFTPATKLTCLKDCKCDSKVKYDTTNCTDGAVLGKTYEQCQNKSDTCTCPSDNGAAYSLEMTAAKCDAKGSGYKFSSKGAVDGQLCGKCCPVSKTCGTVGCKTTTPAANGCPAYCSECKDCCKGFNLTDPSGCINGYTQCNECDTPKYKCKPLTCNTEKNVVENLCGQPSGNIKIGGKSVFNYCRFDGSKYYSTPYDLGFDCVKCTIEQNADGVRQTVDKYNCTCTMKKYPNHDIGIDKYCGGIDTMCGGRTICPASKCCKSGYKYSDGGCIPAATETCPSGYSTSYSSLSSCPDRTNYTFSSSGTANGKTCGKCTFVPTCSYYGKKQCPAANETADGRCKLDNDTICKTKATGLSGLTDCWSDCEEICAGKGYFTDSGVGTCLITQVEGKNCYHDCTCPAGWYPITDADGKYDGRDCFKCPDGYFYNGNVTGVNSCAKCSAGSTYDEEGPEGPQCYSCGNGVYSLDEHRCVCNPGSKEIDGACYSCGEGYTACKNPYNSKLYCIANESNNDPCSVCTFNQACDHQPGKWKCTKQTIDGATCYSNCDTWQSDINVNLPSGRTSITPNLNITDDQCRHIGSFTATCKDGYVYDEKGPSGAKCYACTNGGTYSTTLHRCECSGSNCIPDIDSSSFCKEGFVYDNNGPQGAKCYSCTNGNYSTTLHDCECPEGSVYDKDGKYGAKCYTCKKTAYSTSLHRCECPIGYVYDELGREGSKCYKEKITTTTAFGRVIEEKVYSIRKHGYECSPNFKYTHDELINMRKNMAFSCCGGLSHCQIYECYDPYKYVDGRCVPVK